MTGTEELKYQNYAGLEPNNLTYQPWRMVTTGLIAI